MGDTSTARSVVLDLQDLLHLRRRQPVRVPGLVRVDDAGARDPEKETVEPETEQMPSLLGSVVKTTVKPEVAVA